MYKFKDIIRKLYIDALPGTKPNAEITDTIIKSIFYPIEEKIKTYSHGSAITFYPENRPEEEFPRLFLLVHFSYESICKAHGITPLALENNIISNPNPTVFLIKDMISLVEDSALRFLQLREAGVFPFSSLPEKPSDEEIMESCEHTSEQDTQLFLFNFLSITIYAESYCLALENLSLEYERRLMSICGAFDGSLPDAPQLFNSASTEIRTILDDYIRELKEEGAIPGYWTYSFKDVSVDHRVYKEIIGNDEEYKFNCMLFHSDSFESVCELVRYKSIILESEDNGEDQAGDGATAELREIRVFISSTFSDMQAERDALIRTFNMLAKEAAKRGVTLSVVDLRWGVTPEESAHGEVLDICLKEIEKSKPFFIGLLGDNYGSAPSIELAGNTYLNQQYPWLASDIQNGLSYTEIEIQSAVLRNPERLNAYFYLKADSDCKAGDDSDKLQKLKSEIKAQERYPVFIYNTPEEITARVEADFRSLLDKYLPQKELTLSERTSREQRNLISRLSDFYVPRWETEKAIDGFLRNPDKRLLLLEGPEGIGKSVFLGRLCKELSGYYHVKSYFVAPGKNDVRMSDVVSYLVGTPVDHEEADRVVRKWMEAIGERPMLIVIDGADRIKPGEFHPLLLPWLARVGSNIKIVLSCNSCSPLDTALSQIKSVQILKLGALSTEERKLFIAEYLGKLGKKLTSSQLETLASSHLAPDPAVLRAVMDELVSFGYYEKLDNKVNTLAHARNKEVIYAATLDKIESDYGKDTVTILMHFLLMAPEGLREGDLPEITGLRVLDIALIGGNAQAVIESDAGNMAIRQTALEYVKSRYMPAPEEVDNLRLRLINFFFEKTYGFTLSFYAYDPSRRDFSTNDQIYYICAFSLQSYLLDDDNVIAAFMEDPEFMEVLFRRDRGLANRMWSRLVANGVDFQTPLLSNLENPDIDRNLIPVILNDLSRLAKDCQDGEFAKKCNEFNLAVLEGFGDTKNIVLTRSAVLSNQAICAINENNYIEAANLFAEALALKQKVLTPEDKEIALSHSNLAKALFYCDKEEEALEHFREAERLYRALEGENSEGTLESSANIGRCLFYLRKTSDAINTLNAAVQRCIAVLGEAHWISKQCFEFLGYSWDDVASSLKDKVSDEEYKGFVKQAGICYAKADMRGKAQKMVDIYNSL